MKLKFKIIISAIILLIILAMATQVKAAVKKFELFAGDIKYTDEGRYAPMSFNGITIIAWDEENLEGYGLYCIESWRSLNAFVDKRYKDKPDGYATRTGCSYCGIPAKEWTGSKHSALYSMKDKISYKDHQDTAYILNSSNGEDLIKKQYAIWKSTVNTGSEPNPESQLAVEARKYNDFYKKIHDNDKNDIYDQKVKVNNEKAKLEANKKDGKYIMGPFSVTYPNATYTREDGTVVEFDKMSNIKVVDQDGREISSKIIHKNGTEFSKKPANEEEFYVEFKHSGEQLKYVKLKLDFNYLEECTATMYEYEGWQRDWMWKRTEDGQHSHSNPSYNPDDENPESEYNYYTAYKQVLRKTTGQRLQTLMAGKAGEKIYKDYSIDVELQNTEHKIVLRKVDPKNGDRPLQGATFRVNMSNGINSVSALFETDEQGIIEISPEDYLAPIDTTKFIHLDITEIKAPDGYKLDSRIKTISYHIENGKMKIIKANGAIDYAIDETTNITRLDIRIINEQKTGDLVSIKKVDSQTGQPLKDATFNMKFIDEDGKTIEIDRTTGEDGIAEVNINALSSVIKLSGNIKIQIREITAPDGYILDSTLKEINYDYSKKTISTDGKTPVKIEERSDGSGHIITATIENRRDDKHQFRIVKQDSKTGKRIEGAEFLLTMENGGRTECAVAQTNRYGIAYVNVEEIFKRKVYGYVTVTVEETNVPEGYQIDRTPRTFVYDVSSADGNITSKSEGLSADNNNYPRGVAVLINNEPIVTIDVTMKLAGTAFIDERVGKTGNPNGILDEEDTLLKGIEVILYDKNNNQIARAITDESAKYEFNRLNAMKDYYVTFTYNGQTFTTTEFNKGNPSYNSEQWAVTSKAQERDRDTLNNKFSEIGSYPSNYVSSNNLGYLQVVNGVKGNATYNIAYAQDDMNEIYSIVKEKIKTYVQNKGTYPTDLKSQIYDPIVNEFSSIVEIKNKLQFIEDCKITGDTKGINIPYYDYFNVDGKDVNQIGSTVIAGNKYMNIYPGQLQINLGIKYREIFDMALYKDVFTSEVQLNGKTEIYEYDKRAAGGKTFNMTIRDTDSTKETTYANNKDYAVANETKVLSDLSKSAGKLKQASMNTLDYNYNMQVRQEDIKGQTQRTEATNTGEAVAGGYESELKIFVKYRIQIRNQSGVKGSVTELVDYYDKNYTYTGAYIGDKDGNKIDKAGDVVYSANSKYGSATHNSQTTYNAMYLQLPEIILDNAEDSYVYVTLELKTPVQNARDILSVIKNENDELKTYNFVEVNGYKNSLGIIDMDSTPGNLTPPTKDEFETKKYEDDENSSPALIYKTREARTLEGNVFEDITGLDDNVHKSAVREGNGLFEAKDKLIQGMIVQLVELKNGTEHVRAETKTTQNGSYKFNSYLPGDYTIKYIYGADKDTVLTTSNGGKNQTSYNGQDYRSTKPNTDEHEWWYNNQKDTRKSDAIDNSERRKTVTSNYEYIINHKSQVSKAYKFNPADDRLIEELINTTTMNSYTAKMSLEVEYATKTIDSSADKVYKVQNVDFGISERPKSKLSVEKQVNRIKLVSSTNGQVLVDTSRSTPQNDKNITWNRNSKGKITINVAPDDKLMHGAKLEVEYIFTVRNEGEMDWLPVEKTSGSRVVPYVDYYEKQTIATTNASRIVDYVPNNLIFELEQNGDKKWKVVSSKDLQNKEQQDLTLVLNPIDGKYDLSIYQTIIEADVNNELLKQLKPGEQAVDKLVLTKILSSDNDLDEYNYRNITEIIERRSDVGRKDQESDPGNGDPEKPNNEPDTSVAEEIAIIPKTGEIHYYYILVGSVVIILAAGIMLIKKYAIKK